MLAQLAALALVLTACGGSAPIATCDDLLTGIYLDETAARWMVLDDRKTVEAYPLFADVPRAEEGLEVAPRMIDLSRDGGKLGGFVRRRYMRGSASCIGQVPATATRCYGDTIELVLTDPVAPLSFTPCVWPRLAPSRRERWTRRR